MTAPGAWHQGETCPKSRALATASIGHPNQIYVLDQPGQPIRHRSRTPWPAASDRCDPENWMQAKLDTVTSADGTDIAVQVIGTGQSISSSAAHSTTAALSRASPRRSPRTHRSHL
jgi:hypothetical protein